MRILHIIPSLDMGGVEQLTVNLAFAQKQAGHQAALCCIMSSPEKGVLYEKVRELDLTCYYTYIKHEPRPGPILKLRRLIRKFSTDVLQSHLPRTNAVSAIAGRLAGVRCVISTFHNPYIWKNKSHERWGKLTSFLPDGFFCDSHSIRERLIQECPRLEKRIRVVYPSLPFHEIKASQEDIAEFKNKLGIKEKHKLIGIIARLVDVKDHETFINAAQIVIQEDKDVRFLIIGDGLQRQFIENKIRERKLEEYIHVLGFVPNLDIIWSQLDIFVLTSISEGFPLSILEALRAGIPVVASRVGGIPEIIKDGENGFLCSPKEVQQFARNIIRLLKDDVLLAKMRRNAQQSILPFHMEGMAAKTIQYYKELSR